MRIIISAGGTGGHIYPALAILKKFEENEKDLEVLYIGTHNRMEKELIPKRGIPYEELEIYGFSKKDILLDFKNLFLIHKAKKKCLKIMKEFKPDLVLGIGGYVTYPVIKAASKLGIKTFLHEQNSLPGKTNRVLQKDADLLWYFVSTFIADALLFEFLYEKLLIIFLLSLLFVNDFLLPSKVLLLFVGVIK